jgi:hypothetical protein
MAIRPGLTFLFLGSQESYVRDILSPAVAPIDQGGLGYRAVVVNFRGCMLTFYASTQFALLIRGIRRRGPAYQSTALFVLPYG